MGENIRKIAYGAVLVALAMILGYVESLFPIVISGVGFKVGISNIVTVLCIYLFGPLYAFFIVLLRVVLSDMLFGSLYSLMFSISGFIFSFFAMVIVDKGIKNINNKIYIVSAVGGMLHNIGQILVAYIFIKNIRIFMLTPVYIIAGIIAGLIVGFISNLILRSIRWKIL